MYPEYKLIITYYHEHKIYQMQSAINWKDTIKSQNYYNNI